MVPAIVISNLNPCTESQQQQKRAEMMAASSSNQSAMTGSFRKNSIVQRGDSETFALTPTSISSSVSTILPETTELALCDLPFGGEEQQEQDVHEDQQQLQQEPKLRSCLRKETAQDGSKQKRRSGLIRRRSPSIQHTGTRQIRMPNTGKIIKRKTCVSWDEKVRVRNVPPVSSLTDTPEQLWFQDDEFREIKETCFLIIDVMESATEAIIMNDDSYAFLTNKICIRGLERHMSHKAEVTQARRYAAWDAVLDEQENQMLSNTFNENAMANAYKLRTMESRMEAIRMAQQDRKDIEVSKRA